MDKLVLNGYIERLIASKGHDEEAREAILAFAKTIRKSSRVQIDASLSLPGSTVTGQTPAQGTVQIRDDQVETKEFSRGLAVERVGYYKLWWQQNWLLIATLLEIRFGD